MCHAGFILRFFVFYGGFFSPNIPFTQLPEDLLYESTRAVNEPIAVEFVDKQPINRGRRRSVGVSSGALVVLLDFCASRPESPQHSVACPFCFLLPQIHLGEFNEKETDCHGFYFLFLQFCRKLMPEDKRFLHCTASLKQLKVQKQPHTHKCI